MPTLTQPRRRLNYANVASTLALVIAASTGGAYAAGKIGPNQIQNNAVKSKHIAPKAVTKSDLKPKAVRGKQVKDGSLSSADLSANAEGVAIAGVTGLPNGSIVQSFNRVGGDVTVTNPEAGTYNVTIPGTTMSTFSNLSYSIVGSYANYCFVNTATGDTLQIRCRTFGDVLDSTEFSFLLFNDSVISPRANGTPAKARAESR